MKEKKEIVALFDRPVILPGDEMEEVWTYGLIFRPSNIATFNNISRFIKEYIVVLSTIFQDKEAEVCNEMSFKKGGRVLSSMTRPGNNMHSRHKRQEYDLPSFVRIAAKYGRKTDVNYS